MMMVKLQVLVIYFGGVFGSKSHILEYIVSHRINGTACPETPLFIDTEL